ncbi:MAG: hypothetical protein LBP73_07120 [Clostridiales Family XIII bacterium]|jgi:hypothetical protein|nr:hypothetical protein [Clostridiales Family XIII bacterium]
MKLVYISAPYRADTPEETERNRRAALEACGEAYRLGRLTGTKIVPIAPAGNFPYLDGNKSEDREQELRMDLALLSKCDELWVAGDRISEDMQRELRAAVRMDKPVCSMGLDQATVQTAITDMHPMLRKNDCVKGSENGDYSDKLLILNASVLAPWALEPENQLWIADGGGFGTSPDAMGRALYVTNVFDGEKARFDREDFHGAADIGRLPAWAKDGLAEFQEQNREESEESEQ